MKYTKRVFILFFAVMLVLSMVTMQTALVVNAEGLEDNLTGSESGSGEGNAVSDVLGNIGDQDIGDDEDIADIIGNQQTMTSDQLKQGSIWASPITNIIGYIMGVIIILALALIGLITAVDLLYIAVPPLRNILYKAGTDGTGGYTGGMGAGGYGRGRFGGMMGAGGAAGGTGRPTQWVSDEAVACAAMLGGSAQSTGMQGGMMGGGGMYGGGMYGGGMGGAEAQQPKVRSVIWVYLKKRAVFLVLFVICVVVLTSSKLMGTGANLAQWVLKIIQMFNGKIG